MKMRSVKVLLLLLLLPFCSACRSSKNEQVYFVSRNFYNTLHWVPAEPSFPGEHITYSVEFQRDDEEKYQKKIECQKITALSCNLTEETPSMPDVRYWAQVLVNGKCHGSTATRFTPLADTTFGQPNLTDQTTRSALHVNVTLPMGPRGVSIRDIITNSTNGPHKTEFIYTLEITSPEWAKQVSTNTTGQFVINLKNNKTKYCGNVYYRSSSRWGRPKSENASFCATLQDDPLMLLPWLLIIAISLVAIVLTSVVCMYNYLKGIEEVSVPQTLIIPSSTLPGVLQPQDQDLNISKLVVCPQSDKILYATIQEKPNVASVARGGYSPQDIICQTWQDGFDPTVDAGGHSSDSGDTSARSSGSYGAVVIQVPTEEQATSQDTETSTQPLFASVKGWDNGGMTPMVTSPQLPGLDPLDPGGPLQLHTVQDSDGKLVLPFLTFHLEDSTTDVQRKPLLSDLIDSNTEQLSLASLQILDDTDWSHSESDDVTITEPTQHYCNSHYTPSQPVVLDLQGRLNMPSSDVISDSVYQQNWMPQFFVKTASEYRTNYPCSWNGLRKDDEREEDDVAERLKPSEVLHGDLVIQIQEQLSSL